MSDLRLVEDKRHHTQHSKQATKLRGVADYFKEGRIVGGMVEPPAAPPPPMIRPENEHHLDAALAWKVHESRRHLPPFTKPEPRWRDYDSEAAHKDAWEEWNLERQFHERGIIYNGWRDRDDWGSEVGYIKKVQHQCGLAVVLSIPDISFNIENFGNATDYRREIYTHNIFTEIRTDPDDKFLGLVLSNTYHTPNHYHISLTHTYDVGHGFKYNKKKMREWVRKYDIIRERYNGRRARLGLGKWGNGFTYYINDDTVVEGLEKPFNIFSDPDVHFVFHVPDKYKAGDGMHVSLLI